MSYPDPTAANNAPRPYAIRDQAAPTASSPFASHIAHAWPSSSSSTRGFLTLEHYFQLGNAQLLGVDQNPPNGSAASESISYDPLSGQRGRTASDGYISTDGSHSPAGTRGRGKSRGRGRKRGRGWKSLLKGTEHADLFKPPRLSRLAGGRDMKPRGNKRGGRGSADPGHEFKKVQGQAMEAWMRQDYETAEQLALDAVMINPEVYEAHALVSDVLKAQGREFEALLAKHVGAPTALDPSVYIEVAESWTEMYAAESDERCLHWALDAYRQALKTQQTSCSIRRGMRDAYILLEDRKAAKLMSKSVVRYDPGDLTNVQLYAEFCATGDDADDIAKVKEAYEVAFRLNGDKESLGDVDTQWTYLNVYIDVLDRIGDYVEAVSQLKRKARWFLGRKDETFWDRFTDDDREFDIGHDRRNYVLEFQQGRASRDLQTYGEGLPIELRVKLGLHRIKMGPDYHIEGRRHLNILLHLRDEAEDLHDLFLLSAETLKAFGLHDSAIDFFEVLKTTPGLPDEKVYMSLAECYLSTDRKEDAIDCYLAVIQEDDEHVNARVKLAKLYESIGLRDKAQELADEVIQLGHEKTLQRERVLMRRRKTARKEHTAAASVGPPRSMENSHQVDHLAGPVAPIPRPTSDATSLDKVPTEDRQHDEDMNELDTDDIEDTTMVDAPPQHDVARIKQRKQQRTGLKKLRPLQIQRQIILEHYAVVKELWNSVEEEDEVAIGEWMIHANAMIDEFRSTRAFFPKRYRHQKFRGLRGLMFADEMAEMAAMKERLRNEDDVNEENTQVLAESSASLQFHEIPFSEWHRIAVDLAVLYTKYADQESCYDIVQEVLLKATVFRQDPELSNVTCAFSMYCGILFNDSRMLAESSRHYISSSDFRAAEPYQLLSALVRLSTGEHSAYQDTNLTKFILRSVRMHDYASMSETMRKQYDWMDAAEEKRLVERTSKLGDQDDDLDAGVLALQGHILCTTKTGKYGPRGISNPVLYLFRALALQPDNLTVNLLIGVTFLRGAMYRTSKNRQYGISQAMAFFFRYYELRIADGKASHVQEAEFNLARMWHQLGLTHLAVPGYQKVLDLQETVQNEAAQEDRNVGDEPEDFSKEAALALQGLFVAVGNLAAANAITERWLVL